MLPTLPKGLVDLDCCNNQLTSLPQLPNSLRALYAAYNQLSELPELPSELETLFVDHNQLQALPTALPSSLLTCDVRYNPCFSAEYLDYVSKWCQRWEPDPWNKYHRW